MSCQYKINLGQPRVNLNQKHFWATRGRFMGDRNWIHFGYCQLHGNLIFLVAIPYGNGMLKKFGHRTLW